MCKCKQLFAMSYTKLPTLLFQWILQMTKIGLLEIQFQQLGLFAADAQELLSFFSYNLSVESQIWAVEISKSRWLLSVCQIWAICFVVWMVFNININNFCFRYYSQIYQRYLLTKISRVGLPGTTASGIHQNSQCKLI